jgi:signal peptidase II
MPFYCIVNLECDCQQFLVRHMTIPRHVTLAALLGILVAIADQLSKWWLLEAVMRPPHVEEVTPFLNLVLVHNKGVTFGLLNTIDRQSMPYILAAIAVAILFLLGRWLLRTQSLPVAMGLGFVMGGAVSNLIDRMRYGAVIDFLDFYYQDYHWYAFNIADAAIVTGVGLLLLDSLVRAR